MSITDPNTDEKRNYEEKRDFIRMTINAKVILTVKGQTIAATCHDLSSTGFQLKAPTELGAGDIIDVYVPSDNPKLDGLKAKAKVIWTKTNETGGQLLGLINVTDKD